MFSIFMRWYEPILSIEINRKQTSSQNSNRIDKENDKKHEEKTRRESITGKELQISTFHTTEKKDKDTYLECLRIYKSHISIRSDSVIFITIALKYMKEFGVHKDLNVYKMLLDIFPKGTMIPRNMFQSMFMHYPKHQYCAVDILEQMENNGVIPDPEMESMLLNIFGRHGIPTEKYWKMMYWLPKFKNLNPWPVPKPIPDDVLELAKLAMIKISSVDVRSSITVYDTIEIENSIEETWIVSAIAPKQSELLIQHNKKIPIYVEGPFRIYVAIKAVDYFVLKTKPPICRKYPEYEPDAVDKIQNPYLSRKSKDIILPPSVHEQVDATIFAICATGTSSHDSLLSWIRFLQNENPVLAEIPIVFTLKTSSNEKLFIESNKPKLPSDALKNNNDNELLQG
ncbi:PREDICTED: evolutionarily conserved signaling intermediate in Toll pathway, mitochondrial [Ceratosolen solmsi marchali]|uniref:Evolutionarily conserved signaling intermediate in Toll pathway, mitochondrial n=1 Tax=Ceratosolen solmsi marchali TaxID=326594 RepID=A0AAJ6YS67_9HYME|nr:PREDICTED: evolutionarily conserved signaling intermediate in Toll pathway, mitochondrial [Ceratosolen solmsi marchali]